MYGGGRNGTDFVYFSSSALIFFLLAQVTSVRWSDHSEFYLTSVSHDSTMKVWDTRSSLPLHTVANRHGDKKILCVDWSHPNEILTGGADNKTTCHVIPGSDRMVMNDICDM